MTDTETTTGRRGFATCRACGRPFSAGAGRQDEAAPRLCHDCASRERAYHWGGHAPGGRCLLPLMEG